MGGTGVPLDRSALTLTDHAFALAKERFDHAGWCHSLPLCTAPLKPWTRPGSADLPLTPPRIYSPCLTPCVPNFDPCFPLPHPLGSSSYTIALACLLLLLPSLCPLLVPRTAATTPQPSAPLLLTTHFIHTLHACDPPMHWHNASIMQNLMKRLHYKPSKWQ